MSESYDLPPIMSEAEQQEMTELAAYLRHEAIDHNSETGDGDDEGMLRLTELIDLALRDMEEWRAYLADVHGEVDQ